MLNTILIAADFFLWEQVRLKLLTDHADVRSVRSTKVLMYTLSVERGTGPLSLYGHSFLDDILNKPVLPC